MHASSNPKNHGGEDKNALSPACRLPQELLGKIFIHYARDYHNYSDPDSQTQNVPTWVNVSYVCRYWRDAALDFSTLWTYHFVVSLRWTEELLARSKQAPLQIRITHNSSKSESWWSSLIEKLMNRADHIQEFRLDFPEDCDHQILSQLSARAPRLQNLRISANSYSEFSEKPSVLFLGDTPALRTLHVSHCPFLWSSLKSTSLTSLTLYNVTDQSKEDAEELLATLSCMQDLEQLYFIRTIVTGDLGSFPEAAREFKINLPHLSRLYIAAPLLTAVALLSCVHSPPTTEIRLECFSEETFSHGDYNLLYPVLAQRFNKSKDQALPSPTIRSFVFDIAAGVVDLIFSASEKFTRSSAIRVGDSEWDSNIPLKIFLDFKAPEPTDDGTPPPPRFLTLADVDRVVEGICWVMPLAGVQSVQAIHPQFSSEFWTDMLRHFPALRYLKLSYGLMPSLCSVLSPKGDNDDGEGSEDHGGHAAGKLIALGLEELDLDHIAFAEEDDIDICFAAISQSRLFKALSARDVPEGQLVMTRCRIKGSRQFDSVRSWGGVTRSLEWHSDEEDEEDDDEKDGSSESAEWVTDEEADGNSE